MRVLILSLLLMFVPLAAQAETKDPVFLLGENESLLHISATESREVDQDLLVSTLRIEVENENNSSVQNDINTAMSKALELAKDYDDVKAVTRSYNVHQYDRNGSKRNLPRDMVWKGQQSLQLKSKNAEALLELAGKIQDAGFIMGGLNYMLSPEVSAQVQDEMLEAALEKLTSRANRAAKALGKNTAELKDINAQGGHYNPQPMRRHLGSMAMSASTEMAAPVAAPGETTLTMTVNARAILKP